MFVMRKSQILIISFFAETKRNGSFFKKNEPLRYLLIINTLKIRLHGMLLQEYVCLWAEKAFISTLGYVL